MLSNSNAVTPLLEQKGDFVLDDTLGVALLFAGLYSKKRDNYSIVTSNLYNAQKIATILGTLIGEDNVLLFPNDELLRAENLASSKELVSERIYTISKLLSKKNLILVTQVSGALRYLPSKELFKSLSINLKVGDTVDINDLVKKIVASGYYRCNKIDQSLQFAKRGDILDVFSINYEHPIRISFFGDEIESIAEFDIATQQSKSDVNFVSILPATDMLFTDEEFNNIESKLLEQCLLDKDVVGEAVFDKLKRNIIKDIERLNNHENAQNLYKYYGFLQENHYSIFDYFDTKLVFVANKEQFNSSANLLQKEAQQFLDENVLDGKCITHLSLFQNADGVLNKINKVSYGHLLATSNKDIEFKVRPIVNNGNSQSSIIPTITSYFATCDKVLLAVSSKQQYETLTLLLKETDIDYEKCEKLNLPKGPVGVTLFSLFEGFELLDEKVAVISSRELFGIKTQSHRFIARYKEASILHSYEDLKPGDYVVHEYNGIGKFLDVVTLEVDGIHRDFLHIAYAGTDVLYVPLSQFRLVRKYCGREGVVPRLSHLNSGTWEKTKSKIKERVNELAERLTVLYKDRAVSNGYQFKQKDELEERFNNEFPFDLTDDQAESWREIEKDMESPFIMERLLCGDVGFGKTEVAFRAIFKCINNGKQAALLCPTTLLARQHYEVAKERFANYGINIAIFSRLIPMSEQNKYIKDIKDGKIHLIIGTHRLLSKEITFNDLGLLVVDEEQRFGVEQKEKIKELKKNVDVLTLSATPIPRTLQMSLVGLRALSQINTAPQNRSPIQTYVTPYNEGVIRELIERELGRDGQVFYLHNQVSTIHTKAAMLQRMIPLARIGVVHGQMERDDIEDVMLKFYAGDINLLVCTSIIENGIDVPNANMIVVEDADRFGLSQLYQIKGRVGRGDRIAYAYLLYRQDKILSETATKRLKAIQDFAELGSGYKIAQRDLMIRGAGDMLGPEQAGFIDSIGIDLYIKLLNDAIKGQKQETLFKEEKPNHLLTVDAYIPNSFADKGDKIELYQEIEDANSLDELEKLNKKTKDIYGRLPREVETLFTKKTIDLILKGPEFSGMKEYKDSVEIVLSNKFSSITGVANKLFDAVYPYIGKIKVTYLQRELKIRLQKEELWLDDLQEILKKISKIYIRYKNEN